MSVTTTLPTGKLEIESIVEIVDEVLISAMRWQYEEGERNTITGEDIDTLHRRAGVMWSDERASVQMERDCVAFLCEPGEQARRVRATTSVGNPRRAMLIDADALEVELSSITGQMAANGRVVIEDRTPTIRVVGNPFYLERLAYVSAHLAHELTLRARSAIATIVEHDLRQPGEQECAYERILTTLNQALDTELQFAIDDLAFLNGHDAITSQPVTMAKIRDLAQSQVDAIATSLPGRSGTSHCLNCGKQTLAISPFCGECGLQWRTILPDDEPLDGVGDSGALIATCLLCRAPIHDDGRRDLACPNGCGLLRGEMKQSSCGAVIPSGFRFCPSCGEGMSDRPIFRD